MASKSTINKRVNIYINGKEVANEVKSIKSEMQRLIIAQSKMTIGSKEYVQKTKEIRTLKAILDEHNRSLRTTQTNLFSMGKVVDGFNKYSGIIVGFLGSLTGVVLGFRKCAEEAGKFEENLDNLSALTGLEGKDLSWLGDQAKEMSVKTTESGIRIKQSATDILDAFTKMGSQRPELLKNKEALAAVTEDAIILSEAAKMKLEPATASLANVMNQFNEKSSSSRRIINELAAGSQAGSGDIQYLSDAIEKCGTSSYLMGMKTNETIGVIEAIAPKFKEASQAGNSLDKVLLKLKEKQIGYKTGVFNLNEALEDLQKRFAQGESSASIFGVEHAKMAEVLVLAKDDVIKYTEAVTGTDKALEQAAKNTNNRVAERAQAMNKLKLKMIEVGEKISPAITMSTNAFTRFLNILLEAPKFYKENKQLIDALAVAFTVLSVQSLVGKVIPALSKLKILITSVNTVIKANPIGLLVSGLSFAISYLISFSNKTAEAIDTSGALASAVKDEARQVNELVAKLTAGNTKESERKSIIKELQGIQPKLVEGINAETVATKTLALRLQEYNEEAVKRMALAAKQDAVSNAINKQNELGIKMANEEAEARERLIELQMQLPTLNLKKKTGNQSIWDWKTISEDEKKELISQFNNIFTSSDDWLSKSIKATSLFPESTKRSREFGTIEYKGVDLSGLNNIVKKMIETKQETKSAEEAVAEAKSEVDNFKKAFAQIFTEEPIKNENTELLKQIAILSDKQKLQEYLSSQDKEVSEAAQERLSVLNKVTAQNTDLIKIKEKELEQAKLMPARTKEEIAARNKRVAMLELELKKLKDLGTINEVPQNTNIYSNALKLENDLLNKIKEIRKAIYQNTLSESDKEIQAVKEKYDELIRLARQYKLDVTELERLRANELYDIYIKEYEKDALAAEEYDETIRLFKRTNREKEKDEVRSQYAMLIYQGQLYGKDVSSLIQERDEKLNDIDNQASFLEKVFGLSDEDLEKVNDKITMAIDMASQLSDIWGQFNQIQANKDKKELQDYEKDCNKKKELLNK